MRAQVSKMGLEGTPLDAVQKRRPVLTGASNPFLASLTIRYEVYSRECRCVANDDVTLLVIVCIMKLVLNLYVVGVASPS